MYLSFSDLFMFRVFIVFAMFLSVVAGWIIGLKLKKDEIQRQINHGYIDINDHRYKVTRIR